MKSSIDVIGTAIASLKREEDLIRGAIAMVASGNAARVSLAGLRFGDQLLPVARQMASVAQVCVEPIWNADEEGLDLCIERSSDG